ncbi:MAG: hypothetical protein GY917_31555, partial [Planctomycetaceae bacterium]|nr:hypothetical protein [Planctomycetaceae bacterium]
SVTNLRFGVAALPGRIRGVQFHDDDGDGVRRKAWRSEEEGNEGWQIYLDTSSSSSYALGEPITTTELDGYYEFDNLAPMQTYSVGAILPDGWMQTSPDIKPFPSKLQTLNATTPTRQENFGNTVALSGDTLAIASAPYQQLGATYFYPRADNLSWGEPTRVTLHSSHDDVNVFNPNSLALSSTYAIAGNHYESTQAAEGGMGSAYIFHYGDPVDFWHRPGWTNTARLRPSDGTAGDHFGWSVSVSGQTAIVGAPLHHDEQGAVYIYQENSTPDML